jgi:hypothetical protein
MRHLQAIKTINTMKIGLWLAKALEDGQKSQKGEGGTVDLA